MDISKTMGVLAQKSWAEIGLYPKGFGEDALLYKGKTQYTIGSHTAIPQEEGCGRAERRRSLRWAWFGKGVDEHVDNMIRSPSQSRSLIHSRNIDFLRHVMHQIE